MILEDVPEYCGEVHLRGAKPSSPCTPVLQRNNSNNDIPRAICTLGRVNLETEGLPDEGVRRGTLCDAESILGFWSGSGEWAMTWQAQKKLTEVERLVKSGEGPSGSLSVGVEGSTCESGVGKPSSLGEVAGETRGLKSGKVMGET